MSENITVIEPSRLNPARAPVESRMPVVLDVRVVTGQGGGPEKTILNSPRFLAPMGYENKCAYLHPPLDPGFEQLRRRAQEARADLISIPDRGPFDLSVVRTLAGLCRKYRVEIWHGHDYKSNLLGILLQAAWRCRLVTTVHGWVDLKGRMPLYNRIDKWCLRFFDAVICVSDDLAAECERQGVAASRCHTIHNAIDTDQFRRTRDARRARQKLGFSPERLLIGAVGRLSAEKGFDVLIRAFAQMAREGIDADLVIAGDGDQKGSLESLISSLELQDRVRLLGFRSDTLDLFQALDVFALSSYREGLPNVVLEAMALETPVVATGVAGVPRVITHQVDGLLVAPGSVSELAQALALLCANAELRGRLTTAARETVERRYSFARRMEEIARTYNQVLAR